MMMTTNRFEKKRSGSALVMALASVSVVALLATNFLQYVSTVSNRQAAAIDRKQAFYLAEAGLAEAFSGVVCGRSGAVGTEAEPAVLGDGLFWVEATEVEDNRIQLVSIARAGRARTQLSIVVRKGIHTLLDMGFFSDGDMTIEPGVTIDSYDSSEGDYVDTQTSRARLVSNKAINISGSFEFPTSINGDVICGPEDTVNVRGEVDITGQTLVSPEAVVVPSFPTPEVEYIDAITIDSPFPFITPPTVLGLRGLTVTADSEVVLQGPSLLVFENLLLEPGATLSFDTTNGPIALYITNSMDLQAGANVTTSSTDPSKVLVFVNQEMTGVANLRANAAFHGVLFAPNTVVNVSETFEIFGAIGALSLLFEGPVQLHFDHLLISRAQELRKPIVESWKIDELSIPPGLISDPFVSLGLDRSSLKAPAQACEDQALKITYLDAGGDTQMYSGPESGFDWGTVTALVSAIRDDEPIVIPKEDRFFEVNNQVSEKLGFGGIAKAL